MPGPEPESAREQSWTRHAFQTYDDVSDAATVAPRLAALRAELAARGLDGFVVPHADEHQSEYLPARAERLAWLTAFTGSAGAAVVLTDKAAVFVDGRYTLQVRAQTDTACSSRAIWWPKDRKAGFPTICRGRKLGYDPWLHRQWRAHLARGGELGFDPWLHRQWRGGPAPGGGARGRTWPCDSNPHRRGLDRPAAAARQARPCRMPSTWRAKPAEANAPAWPRA